MANRRRWRVSSGALGLSALAIAVVSTFVDAAAHGAAGEPPARAASGVRFEREVDVSTFSKGNLHAHSTESDGDSSPEAVVAWYRDHGYRFLALTDHRRVDDVGALAAAAGPRLTLLPAEEITMTGGGRAVHVNGLCIDRAIDGGAFPSAREAIAHATAGVRAAGGVALVNHPNFDWGLGADDVAGARGAALLEVESGHPYVRPLGDALHPSDEELWDAALSRGNWLAPAGVDDLHHLGPRAPGEWAARPGRAWVEVFGAPPDARSICDALERGDVYASNGPAIARLRVTANEVTVWTAEPRARVDFVGQSGAVLASSAGATEGASYELRGDETYVRARVVRADGAEAFLPAFRVIPAR